MTVTYTDNHSYPEITVGTEEDNWGDIINNDLISNLEVDSVVITTSGNQSNFTPHIDSLLYETDTGAFYIGDGSAWNQTELETRLSALEGHDNTQHSVNYLPQSDYNPETDTHDKYTNSEAISAINNDTDHGSTAPHNYFSGDYPDLTNREHDNTDHTTDYLAQSNYNPETDTHDKTTSISEITDIDFQDVEVGTLSNRPAAGTSGNWYFTTDSNGLFYDDGGSWNLIAEYPGNITASDLGFDPATQTELNNHSGDSAAHHAKFTDSEAQTAINNDSDHGSTAQHDYFSGDYNDLTNRSHGNEDHDNVFISDGDGTTRQYWVIANGASDPSGAGSNDIIFEEEA